MIDFEDADVCKNDNPQDEAKSLSYSSSEFDCNRGTSSQMDEAIDELLSCTDFETRSTGSPFNDGAQVAKPTNCDINGYVNAVLRETTLRRHRSSSRDEQAGLSACPSEISLYSEESVCESSAGVSISMRATVVGTGRKESSWLSGLPTSCSPSGDLKALPAILKRAMSCDSCTAVNADIKTSTVPLTRQDAEECIDFDVRMELLSL
mmetsp:Transcript_56131/g.156405  ORF Transcript_56131/g.156405 Transcript_56131/m.156405 type:complete len:207 (-) Transcript_56131:152-772(-)